MKIITNVHPDVRMLATFKGNCDFLLIIYFVLPIIFFLYALTFLQLSFSKHFSYYFKDLGYLWMLSAFFYIEFKPLIVLRFYTPIFNTLKLFLQIWSLRFFFFGNLPNFLSEIIYLSIQLFNYMSV